MPTWLVNLIVKLILDEITEGGIEKLAEKLKNYVIPLVREGKDKVFEKLKKTAEEQTPGFPLDDVLVTALDEFFEALIPDCKALAGLSSSTSETVVA